MPNIRQVPWVTFYSTRPAERFFSFLEVKGSIPGNLISAKMLGSGQNGSGDCFSMTGTNFGVRCVLVFEVNLAGSVDEADSVNQVCQLSKVF